MKYLLSLSVFVLILITFTQSSRFQNRIFHKTETTHAPALNLENRPITTLSNKGPGLYNKPKHTHNRPCATKFITLIRLAWENRKMKKMPQMKNLTYKQAMDFVKLTHVESLRKVRRALRNWRKLRRIQRKYSRKLKSIRNSSLKHRLKKGLGKQSRILVQSTAGKIEKFIIKSGGTPLGLSKRIARSRLLMKVKEKRLLQIPKLKRLIKNWESNLLHKDHHKRHHRHHRHHRHDKKHHLHEGEHDEKHDHEPHQHHEHDHHHEHHHHHHHHHHEKGQHNKHHHKKIPCKCGTKSIGRAVVKAYRRKEENKSKTKVNKNLKI